MSGSASAMPTKLPPAQVQTPSAKPLDTLARPLITRNWAPMSPESDKPMPSR